MSIKVVKKEIPCPIKAYSLSGPYGYGKRKHRLYQEESSPLAQPKLWPSIWVKIPKPEN